MVYKRTQARPIIGQAELRYGFLALAIVLLLLGGMIYVLYRPTSLLLFRWAETLQLMPFVHGLRSHAGCPSIWPEWFVYSAPFAFWVTAYQLVILVIWFAERHAGFLIWFWSAPLMAIGSELLQYPDLVPGVYDAMDMATILIACLFALVVERRTANRRRIS